MTKKLDNSTFENDADKKALASIDMASADPFGDLDDDEPAALEAAADGPEDDEIEDTPGDSVDGDEADPKAVEAAAEVPPEGEKPAAEAAAEPAQPAATVPPPTLDFKTLSKPEMDAQRATLRAEKQKAFADFDEGTIDRAAYQAIEARVDDALEDLTSQRALLQATEQSRLTSQSAKLDAIKAAAKAEGSIDYGDQDAAEEFNSALQFVASVKGNAGLNFDKLADKAHTMVLAQRGIAPKAAAPVAPAGLPPERRIPRAPITLAGIPAAATPNGNGGVGETLGRLHGLDFQDAIGKMPKAQRDAWLDS